LLFQQFPTVLLVRLLQKTLNNKKTVKKENTYATVYSICAFGLKVTVPNKPAAAHHSLLLTNEQKKTKITH